MSGHSKWSTIRHKKAINDAKKGKIFSKLAQQITVAAQQGGADVDSNPTLRLLVSKAKSESMPVANIDRAIEKGAGIGEDATMYESVSYEGLAVSNVSFIVDLLTDNKNRSVADLRKMFTDAGGSLTDTGSVSWNFDTKGMVIVKCAKEMKSTEHGVDDKEVVVDKEIVLMELLDIVGVTDIKEERSIFVGHSGDEDESNDIEVYTKFEDLGRVRDAIVTTGYIVKEALPVKICKVPKDRPEGEIKRVVQFIDSLLEMDEVQRVWTDCEPAKLMDAMYAD